MFYKLKGLANEFIQKFTAEKVGDRTTSRNIGSWVFILFFPAVLGSTLVLTMCQVQTIDIHRNFYIIISMLETPSTSPLPAVLGTYAMCKTLVLTYHLQ